MPRILVGFFKSFLSFLLLISIRIISGIYCNHYQYHSCLSGLLCLPFMHFFALCCSFPPFPASSCTFKLCPFHSKSTGINSSNFNYLENIHSIKYKHTQSHTITSIPPHHIAFLWHLLCIAFSSPSRLHLFHTSSATYQETATKISSNPTPVKREKKGRQKVCKKGGLENLNL